MHVVDKLRSEHEEVEAQARRLAQIVRKPLPPHPAEFERARREFVIELKRHLRHEDAVLYPRLLESPDPSVRDTARMLLDEAGALSVMFDAFCERWTGSAIVADWALYCEETDALLQLLHRRIAIEEFELYPLLEAQLSAEPRADCAPRSAAA